jgi:tetratricopeptide (TPR) repeat protein
MKRAQELDPLSPIIVSFTGEAHCFAGKNDKSIAEYQKVLTSDPAFPVARSFPIHALEQAGRFEETISQNAIIARANGASTEGTNALRHQYEIEGVHGHGRKRLDEMGGQLEQKPGVALGAAAVYAKLGDKDRAFSFLERAVDEHELWLECLKVDPQRGNLRSDSRYESPLPARGAPMERWSLDVCSNRTTKAPFLVLGPRLIELAPASPAISFDATDRETG